MKGGKCAMMVLEAKRAKEITILFPQPQISKGIRVKIIYSNKGVKFMRHVRERELENMLVKADRIGYSNLYTKGLTRNKNANTGVEGWPCLRMMSSSHIPTIPQCY